MPHDLKSYRNGDPESKQGRSDSRLREHLEQTWRPESPATERLKGINSRTNTGEANGDAPRDRGRRS